MSAVHVLAVVAALSPLVAGLVGARARRQAGDIGVSVVGLVAGIAVLAIVVIDGAVRLAGGLIVIDRVGAAWSTFALVTALSVRTFASRQLSADPERHRFAVSSGAAASAGIALFWAGNLASLVVAAVLTSFAATWLVTYRADSVRVRRPMLRTLLGADLILLVGVLLLVAATGEVSFSAGALEGGPAVQIAAVALVVAALARCAQPPFHGWLVRSLVAPTPSSALLHAGLVNAGGVLLIRTAPVLATSVAATVFGLALATSGIVLGLAVMRRRHEVKTALVWSTVAQMGFMLVQVLVGLGAAAAAHLIAHGAYKSSLFLASGSTLEHRRVPRIVPGRRLLAVAGVVAVGVVSLATAVSGYDIGGHGGASVLLPAFAIATGFGVLAAPTGLAVGPVGRRIGLGAVVGALVTMYLGLIAWFEAWLAVEAPVPTGALTLVLVVVGVVAVASVLSQPHSLHPEAAWRIRWSAWLEAIARRPALDAAVAAPLRVVGPAGGTGRWPATSTVHPSPMPY